MDFFFLLKKWIAPLFSPLLFPLLLSLAGLVFHGSLRGKKIARVLAFLGLAGLFVAGSPWGAGRLASFLEAAYPPQTTPDPALAGQVKYIVVLGGGHNPSAAWPPSARLSGEALARLVEGVRLHRLLPGTILLLSGGAVYQEDPAAVVLRDAAVAMGVDPGAIELEAVSLDTADEARLIAPMTADAPFLLVTTAMHMPRSMKLFERWGSHPIAAPAGPIALRPSGASPLTPGEVYPSAATLYLTERAAHEYLGLFWARIKGDILD